MMKLIENLEEEVVVTRGYLLLWRAAAITFVSVSFVLAGITTVGMDLFSEFGLSGWVGFTIGGFGCLGMAVGAMMQFRANSFSKEKPRPLSRLEAKA